ncbi:hypothetical protein M408DRAFT_19842 [Serendipita vermifera MAFF 305830]|uniref:Uncharacterized protein n=1 Tax=Serendipita vermifera MAFF 305830 TaxID=933852 RepID=A0A0C3BQ36_SERVB|nr:hypothetical protein M408DRAFT_19842 [Serendipita vermifera MAFF 305830]
MSGGNYRLIRTDSREEGHLDDSYPLPRSLSSLYTFLPTKWLPARPKSHPKGFYESSRRLSRGSDCSATSIPSTLCPKRKNQFFIACCVLILVAISFVTVGLHWDKVEEFYFEQFIMPTPGNACLVDPSSPASYVHWNPRPGARRAIYHCISRPPSPLVDEQLALPAGASLRTYRPLPASCLDSYYTEGSGCTDRQNTKFNVVWTWVNGTDPMITRAKAKATAELKRQSGEYDEEEEEPPVDEEEEEKNFYLFRDHDELRHSLRSVLQYFRQSAKKFVLLTSDFEFPVQYEPIKYLLGLNKHATHPIRGSTEAAAAIHKRDEQAEFEEEYPEEELFASARLGLLPQWLVFDLPEEPKEGEAPPQKQTIGQWKDGDIPLEVVHHAEIYEEYDGTVFNSNSIESQLANTVGDETFLYFNDDCFFAAPLSSADFHTHNFGLVFRLIAYPFNLVDPHHYPQGSPIGEWYPMEFTNFLLSERFGVRRRPYPMHQVKVLQGTLMREMWDAWPMQETLNRRHKFRGLGGVHPVAENHTMVDEVDPLDDKPRALPVDEEEEEEEGKKLKARHQFIKRSLGDEGVESAPIPVPVTRREPGDEDIGDDPPPVEDSDAHVMFLFTHFVIERSREAMLWSWIVAALGGDNDEFGSAQKNAAWRILTEDAKAQELERGKLQVLVERRATMEPWRVQWALDVVGDTLKASNYRFSSQDGDAYSYYTDEKGLEWWHWNAAGSGSTYWPLLFDDNNFSPEIDNRPAWSRCTIDWNVCFDPKLNTASDIFKRVAFEERECGDCILKGLVRASGNLGLSALLPKSDRVYRPQTMVSFAGEGIPPHLPLVSEWDKADFSLAGVFASGFWTREDGVGLREWVQRMMERYRYVLADTDNYFNVITNPVSAEKTFAYVDDHPTVALVTINDVINEYPEQTDRSMRQWFENRWPTPAEWENPALVPKFDPETDPIAFDTFRYRER